MNIKGYRVREAAAKARRQRMLVSPEVRAERARLLEIQAAIAAGADPAQFETPAQADARLEAEEAARAALDAEAKAAAERQAVLDAEEKAAAEKTAKRGRAKTAQE